jgi:hypothetical protein
MSDIDSRFALVRSMVKGASGPTTESVTTSLPGRGSVDPASSVLRFPSPSSSQAAVLTPSSSYSRSLVSTETPSSSKSSSVAVTPSVVPESTAVLAPSGPELASSEGRSVESTPELSYPSDSYVSSRAPSLEPYPGSSKPPKAEPPASPPSRAPIGDPTGHPTGSGEARFAARLGRTPRWARVVIVILAILSFLFVAATFLHTTVNVPTPAPAKCDCSCSCPDSGGRSLAAKGRAQHTPQPEEPEEPEEAASTLRPPVASTLRPPVASTLRPPVASTLRPPVASTLRPPTARPSALSSHAPAARTASPALVGPAAAAESGGHVRDRPTAGPGASTQSDRSSLVSLKQQQPARTGFAQEGEAEAAEIAPATKNETDSMHASVLRSLETMRRAGAAEAPRNGRSRRSEASSGEHGDRDRSGSSPFEVGGKAHFGSSFSDSVVQSYAGPSTYSMLSG